MTIAAASGFAKGFIQTPYPGAAGKVPVLSSFYFGYGVGGRPFDNHLAVLSVLPGGPSADLTPGADLSPSQVAPGTVDLDFQDSDPDRYFYRSEHVLLDASVATRFQLRDVGGVGSERTTLPQTLIRPQRPGETPDTLALAGFQFFFTGNRDHHIDQIAVMLEDDNELFVAFHDRNSDDVFAYLVDLVRISGSPLSSSSVGLGTSGGVDKRGGENITIPLAANSEPFLRGFNFDFRGSDDNHLREIGVITSGNRMSVFFDDVNPQSDLNDEFTWEVRWGHIGT